jgi:hypothetical protein
MAISVTMDTSNLKGALSEIARLTGKDFRTVVRSETQKIFEKALSNTPVMLAADIQTTKSPTLRAQKLAARGLLKKVFVQAAEKVQIQLEGTPAYVDRAMAPGGDFPEDAQAKENTKGRAFSIDGEIFRTYDPRVFGALAKAVNGRTGFFRANLRRGVFDKMETIARKYPGMFVHPD